MNEPYIDPQVQVLLQYADEEVLVHTIRALSVEQKKSHIFKQLGEQRYLSALRAGAIDNAEMTKLAFKMDPFFLKSRVVNEAAWAGLKIQIELAHPEVAEKIEKLMNLSDETGARIEVE